MVVFHEQFMLWLIKRAKFEVLSEFVTSEKRSVRKSVGYSSKHSIIPDNFWIAVSWIPIYRSR